VQRPSKEEWKAWVRDPITQHFLSDIQGEREYAKEGWAQGAAGEDAKRIMGMCQGLQRVIDYATKDFEYLGKKEEQDHVKSAGVSDSSETSGSGDND